MTATAAAAEVNQAMIQATEAPRAAMTVMQTALASQQATAASISADLSAGRASEGSDTGTAPDASGSAVILPSGKMPDSCSAPKLDKVTAATPNVIVARHCPAPPAVCTPHIWCARGITMAGYPNVR